MLFRLVLYQLVAEDNPDQRQIDDAELDKVQADYRELLAEAAHQNPGRAHEIKAAEALFNRASSNARPVSAAALAGSREKAMNIMRTGADADLRQARQAMTNLVNDMQKSANQESDELEPGLLEFMIPPVPPYPSLVGELGRVPFNPSSFPS